MDAAKLIIEVTAGIIPGEPIDSLTRRWVLTVDEVRDMNTLTDAGGAAMLYAAAMANPAQNNWVRHEWTWL